MAVVAAFNDGAAASKRQSVLLVAGLVPGAGSQLRHVDDLVGSPVLSAGASVAWLVAFPFVLGTARDAVEGPGVSPARIVTSARTHYLRPVLATVLFVGIVLGAGRLLGVAGLVFGIGTTALTAAHELLAVAAGIGSMLVWLASVLVVCLFVQFYDAATVVEDHGVTGAFRSSARLVRANLTSVVGVSEIWLVLSNAFRIPEFVRRTVLIGRTPPDAPGCRSARGRRWPVGGGRRVLLHAAYYLRLIATTAPLGRGG
ncbi:DUF7847 domain-containing protein [Halobellus ruber]|uniref:DUF7847 domain-containing protein n=1 Tax=Halobellus ruber TaxID=2761102 RepID=UPI001FE41D47|nr:hypothetical protein [Halobellus ruber]